MSVYRKVAGIDFGNDDDEMLDRWLDGADAAWQLELKSKGDQISLAEVLERAIEGGMNAIGVRLESKNPVEPPERHRGLARKMTGSLG